MDWSFVCSDWELKMAETSLSFTLLTCCRLFTYEDFQFLQQQLTEYEIFYILK